MKFVKKICSLLLVLTLCAGLAVPAMASEAMGSDLSSKEIELHKQTQVANNVFWSATYSDLRTENYITYAPNEAVKPMVTYGGTMTERTSVAEAAKALEAEGYRVVAGINGDFYDTSNGLPIGLVMTDGLVRSSDGGYFAIGFRQDGSAVLGKPGISVSVDLGYTAYNENGEAVQQIRNIAAVNKMRISGGIFLYTYEFNAKHTTGTVDPGVNVLCTILEGDLRIGGQMTARVETVQEGPGAVSLQPDQVAMSVHGESNGWFVNALRDLPEGTEITFSVTANEGWEEVDSAVGALYVLAENGTAKEELPAGAHPRTAIGQKADGTLIFYTMDGRKSGYSVGCTLIQVAKRMIELGCETVLGLDGGGSTNLAVTTPDSTEAAIFNTPSENGRKVTNQVFLVASNRSGGGLHHFYVAADSDYVLGGSKVGVTATAVDGNYIPMARSYSLTSSAGSLKDHVLTTPKATEDVTVTASGGGKKGSTVVHVIETPDELLLKNGTSTIRSLTVTPGASLNLTAVAKWNHLTLKADPEVFTWSVSGQIGTVDSAGKFTAAAPGEGSITVAVGEKSLTIPVTVMRIPLKTVENFESGTGNITDGEGLAAAWITDVEKVRYGWGALALTYRDLENNAEVSNRADYEIPAAYHAVSLWVCGDGSGNTLLLTTESEAVEICTLDFTGWRQVCVKLPDDARKLTGMAVRGVWTNMSAGENGEGSTVLLTASEGTIYIDQIVATFEGTLDTEAPQIKAELDPEKGIVTAKISDGVDGVLPTSAILACYNGSALAEVFYDAQKGELTLPLPETDENVGEVRITITAKDASGNIGRASVDVPTQRTEHFFADTANHWAADYIDFLYTAGITKGYDDGSFQPDDKVSRAQFAVMLYRYLGLREEDYAEVKLPFADAEKIPDYAVPAVKALYTMNILKGSERSGKLYLDPNSTLSRAQAATMIGRTQEKGYALAELTFKDAGSIPEYAAAYIRSMVSQKILSGYDDGRFHPNDNITRGQMAKILYTLM